MKLGYVRVSTVEQNEERQIEGLQKYGIDKWFTEKISGKNTHRPELQRMLSEAQAGDTIYVHDFSRLARSTKDLLDIVEQLNEHGISLVSNKECVDTNSPQGKLMLTMMAAIYEFERTNMLERQREGIVIAKREGKFDGCGRKEKVVDLELFRNNLNRYMDGDISKTEFANRLDVSRPTLDKLIKKYEGDKYD